MNNVVHTRCCIAGGGPAGMMSALLLARMGVNVFVLEKHADFLRDFHGDTIHPSTLEIMFELCILDEFLKRPHQEIRGLAGQVGQGTVTIGDFTHLPTHCYFLAIANAGMGRDLSSGDHVCLPSRGALLHLLFIRTEPVAL
jgi:2-polyprenyl-6-methoxyphenol hydroxylase-like FAD-dependent oxidoreductase